jgi:NAD(P)-dependent dehydrogenase (short-subunit alcohol dehydrogenase family)
MSDDLSMEGRVALVTGGAKGVGRGITEAFLARGAQVVACGRTEPAPPPSVAGREASFVLGDVRDAEQVAVVINTTIERFGHLDVVVNNAGGAPPSPIAGASPRFLQSIITLNLVAPLLVAQRANDVMQQQPEGGLIINIASVSGLRPSPGSAPYGAAKAGLISLTESLAIEWAPKVRVNAVTPGIVGTDNLREIHYGGDEARMRQLAAQVPLGRLASPQDVGGVCVFLASRLAQHMTGSNVVVHGGGEPADSLNPGGAHT